jgi:pimeloyl-ACP methyl ester carboxylesterase
MNRRQIIACSIAALLPAALGTTSEAATESNGAVEEASYVEIGGTEQWLHIRGDDPRNPILLILHGGPGSTWDPFMDLFRNWEQHFTMAYWSQRGAGKSYRRSGPTIAATMTIDRMIEDAIEMAQYLTRRLDKRRVIVLAHSWGTVLGTMAVQRRPDLFVAYVGTGQLVNAVQGERAGREETLRRARVANRQDAVAALEALGEPPYDDINKMIAERKWADVFDTPSDAQFNQHWRNPAYFTDEDNAERTRAWLFSNLIMWGDKRQDGPIMKVDFAKSAVRFSVPIFFIQGGEDHITQTKLVAAYERKIVAPQKALIVLPDGGHNVVITMPDKFLAAMNQVLGGLVPAR